MKHSVRVAYGGMLTGISVVFLLLASLMPALGWGLCIGAGMVPAIHLARRQVRMGLLIYVATSLLSAMFVPGKRYVVAYALLFGFYPLVKYGIERLHKLPVEWACKLLYAVLLLVALWCFIRWGFLVPEAQVAAFPPFLLAIAFFIAFVCYDVVFSKIIALFRILFRE